MAELFSIPGPQQEIIDIDLTPVAKKAIRINQDNSRILYLNVSDMTIGARLEEAYPKLREILASMKSSNATIADTADDENMEEVLASVREVTGSIKNADEQMRDLMDYIFDSNVSEVCAPEGTMYDMFNGVFRFEYILETLIKLYTDNLDKEYKKLKSEVSKHTSKYHK